MNLATLPRCTGHCQQGHAPCACSTGHAMPAEACTELGADTTATPPSLWRRLLIARARWQLACLTNEREHYQSLGWVGPIYLRESYAQQRQLMARIRELQAEPPARRHAGAWPRTLPTLATAMVALTGALTLGLNSSGGAL